MHLNQCSIKKLDASLKTRRDLVIKAAQSCAQRTPVEDAGDVPALALRDLAALWGHALGAAHGPGQVAGQEVLCRTDDAHPQQQAPGTMRFGSTAKGLAECKLKYYRISECRARA